MRYLDCIFTGLRALKTNVMRSVLTTLGIIIGVGAVIVMISVGAGAEARMEELISSLGSNLLIVMPGTSTAGGVRLGRGTLPTITEDDAAAIQSAVDAAAIHARSPHHAVGRAEVETEGLVEVLQDAEGLVRRVLLVVLVPVGEAGDAHLHLAERARLDIEAAGADTAGAQQGADPLPAEGIEVEPVTVPAERCGDGPALRKREVDASRGQAVHVTGEQE